MDTKRHEFMTTDCTDGHGSRGFTMNELRFTNCGFLQRVVADRARGILADGLEGVGAAGGARRHVLNVKSGPEDVCFHGNGVVVFAILCGPRLFRTVDGAEVGDASNPWRAAAAGPKEVWQHRVRNESNNKNDCAECPGDWPWVRFFLRRVHKWSNTNGRPMFRGTDICRRAGR